MTAWIDAPQTDCEHAFVPVKAQTGCASCGYSRGHHPSARTLQATRAACEHEPDTFGVKCQRCGIPAEMVGPDELAEHLTLALQTARLAARGQLGMFQDAPVVSRCWHYLHTQGGTRRCVIEPDYHDGAHLYEPRLTPMGRA